MDKACLVIYSEDIWQIGIIVILSEELRNLRKLEIHQFSSALEFYYYYDLHKDKRIASFESGLFDRINNLKEQNFLSTYYNNIPFHYQILKKKIKNDKIFFKCKSEMDDSVITIPATSIFMTSNCEPDKNIFDNIEQKEVPVTMIDDIFVRNDNKFEDLKWLKKYGVFEIDDLVRVVGYPMFYGHCRFFLSIHDFIFVGIEVDKSQIKINPVLKNIIFRKSLFNAEKYEIVVNSKKIEKFVNVKYKENSLFIDKTAIKILEEYQSKIFNKGNIVKFLSSNIKENFVVLDSFLINKIPSLEVAKAIRTEEMFTTEFLKEEDVCKLDFETKLTYFCGTIIDPKSLLTFVPTFDENFKENNKVKFCLNDMKAEYEGFIIMTGKTNGILCSLVKVVKQEDENLNSLCINKEKSFSLIEQSVYPIVIIPNYILQIISPSVEVINGIPVLNSTVKSTEVKAINEKIIVFRYKGIFKSVLIKWKGYINSIFCLGFEIKNFSFEDQIQNYWIPLEILEDCCEKSAHKTLKSNKDKIIDPRSICCIRKEKNTILNSEITINVGDQVKRRSGKERGICKWRGIINKVQVIGLELTSPTLYGTNGIFCDYNLFQCKPNCGILCEAGEFEYEKLTLRTISGLKFNIVDPFLIKTIENGKECNMNLYMKSKWINIQWKGCINDYFCIGFPLNFDSEYGSNGTFNNLKLFNCLEKRGVIIPVNELKDCCLATDHKEITKIKEGIFLRSYMSINPDCICCIEHTEEIKQWPKLEKGSSVTFVRIKNKKVYGICKWVGLINGEESVGIETAEENMLPGGTDGHFKSLNLFSCAKTNGYLFLAEDIIPNE